MYGEKALELVRELERSGENIPPFNEDKVLKVLDEMRALFQENQADVTASVSGDAGHFAAVQLRHVALERNKRCLLAYVYNRMQTILKMRWEFGSILPADIKSNLSESESQTFLEYSKILAQYMQSIRNGQGLDLTQNRKPPKSLFIQVKCLTDHGELEMDDGSVILLKKNTQHFLPRSQCEHLISQGILEHIV